MTGPPPPAARHLWLRSQLRNFPERLFLPLASLWLLVNVAPWGFGTGYLVSFYEAFTFQKSNVIFPFTYAFAVTSFGLSLGAGLRWARLPAWRAFLIGGTVPFAGPAAFEIAFQESGRLVHPGLFVGYALPYVMFSYGTWVLLGLTGVGWWRLSWPWLVALVYSIGGFLAWVALGMPLVTSGSWAQVPLAYFFNLTLKASCFIVFLLPVLNGMHDHRVDTGKRDPASTRSKESLTPDQFVPDPRFS
jgi:hypothetical protein